MMIMMTMMIMMIMLRNMIMFIKAVKVGVSVCGILLHSYKCNNGK